MPDARRWAMVQQLEPGMRVRLKKPHPCGSYEWIVVAVKGDVRLDCARCGRRVILTRRRLANRIQAILPPEPPSEPPPLISLDDFLQLRQHEDGDTSHG